MPITGEMTITFRNIRRFVGPTLLRMRVVAVILVCVYGTLVLARDDDGTAPLALACGLFLLAFFELITAVTWYRCRGLVQHYELGDDGLAISTLAGSQVIKWDAVSAIRRRRSDWVLRIGATKGRFPLPRFVFDDAAQVAIDDFFASRWPDEGRRRRRLLSRT